MTKLSTLILSPAAAISILGMSCFVAACSASGSSPSTDGDTDNPNGDGDGDTLPPGDGDGDGLGSGGLAGDGDAPGGGTGGTPSGSGGSGSGGTLYACPIGSDALQLDLAGKTATDISGIPLPPADNYFLEGPVWIGDSLYMSQIREYGDYPPSRILKYTPGGTFTPFIESAGTNGLAVNAAGQLVGASHAVGGIVTFDPANAATPATTITATYDGARLNSPNDLAVRSDGTIYFTDPTWQCGGSCTQDDEGVYRVAPGGNPEALVVLQNKPNGIALSPDEATLYVGGDVLASYPVNSDGTIGGGANFGSGGSDGLALDCAGNVYTTQNGAVVVYSPAGQSLGSIPAAGATNVAFGGASRTTLFITGMSPGTLRSVELNIPGFPY